MENIVICADDFGRTHKINQAIMELLQEGHISTAAVLVNTQHTQSITDFLRRFPKNNFHLGLHLEISSPEEIRSETLSQQYEKFTDLFAEKPHHLSLHYSEPIAGTLSWEEKKELSLLIKLLSKKTHTPLRAEGYSVWSYRADTRLSTTRQIFETELQKASKNPPPYLVIVHPGYDNDPELISTYNAARRNTERKLLTTIGKTGYLRSVGLTIENYHPIKTP